MLLLETEVRKSDVHGLGLFCRHPIPKGTKVWEFNPLFDIVVDESGLEELPDVARAFLQMYAYRSSETNQLILNLDQSRHMNHAEHPNLVSDGNSSYFAAHDIPAGSELTCNYREFFAAGNDPFHLETHVAEPQPARARRS